MSTDMYRSPSRAEIAARVNGGTPPAKPAPDPLECFAVWVRAGLKARGWTNAQLAEHSGCDPITIGKAVNRTATVGLGAAAKIARVLGKSLPEMLGPYTCGTCTGQPPAGFACMECGTEGRRPA